MGYQTSQQMVIAALVFLLCLPSTASGGTPQQCQLPNPYNCVECSADDGSGNSTCTIRVSQSAGKATVQVLYAGVPQGTANQNICIDPGVPITFVNDSGSYPLAYFGVLFGSANPFNGYAGNPVVITGGTLPGIKATGTVSPVVPPSPTCYSFNIAHCAYNAASAEQCSTADPKVIVDGGDKNMACGGKCKKKHGEERTECINDCKKNGENSTR